MRLRTNWSLQAQQAQRQRLGLSDFIIEMHARRDFNEVSQNTSWPYIDVPLCYFDDAAARVGTCVSYEYHYIEEMGLYILDNFVGSNSSP